MGFIQRQADEEAPRRHRGIIRRPLVAPAAPEERQGGDLEADGGAGGLLDGFVAVALFILIGWAFDAAPSTFDLDAIAANPSRRYHTKLSEEERRTAVRALPGGAADGDEPRLGDDGRGRTSPGPEGVEGLGAAPFPFPHPLPNIRSVHFTLVGAEGDAVFSNTRLRRAVRGGRRRARIIISEDSHAFSARREDEGALVRRETREARADAARALARARAVGRTRLLGDRCAERQT